jgi:hypothetical protein
MKSWLSFSFNQRACLADMTRSRIIASLEPSANSLSENSSNRGEPLDEVNFFVRSGICSNIVKSILRELFWAPYVVSFVFSHSHSRRSAFL